MNLLTETEIAQFLLDQPLWRLDSNRLLRDWTFPDFASAMLFVKRVAAFAEAANHHPDIDIRYNRVRLALLSHDAGGITRRDISLARQLSL